MRKHPEQSQSTVFGCDSPAATAELHACDAPLSDMMAQLWETTDAEQLHDLLCRVSQEAETLTLMTASPTSRAWHHECGRRPVLSKDLGIAVSDASTLPTCVKNECGVATCRILRDEFVNVRNEN